jgi:hypothetical protein
MPEAIVAAILFVLCCGQVLAGRRGGWHSAVYYVCVSPLGYFSLWLWGTWSPDRLCAAIAMALWLTKSGSPLIGRRSGFHPYFGYGCWGVAMTALAGLFLPEYSESLPSSAYREWRMWIQLANWVLLLGGGWVIGKAFKHPGTFSRARPIILAIGEILCAYALYQALAYWAGLPTTGIRRPVAGVTSDGFGEQFSAYTLEGRAIFRPGSLIGEAKGLGGACVFWLALILSTGFDGRLGWGKTAELGLVLLTLWLTASTSAWSGAVLVLLLGVYLIGWRRVRRLRVIFGALLLLTLTSAVWLRIGGMSWQGIASEIALRARVRLLDRFAEQGPLGDLAEQVTLEVLKSDPILAFVGTGYGGMSAHIAAALAGTSQLVLFPNNGLLGMVSNFGLVGMLLMLWSLRRGLGVAFLDVRGERGEVGAMAFVGAAALLQCFIFSQPWLLSWAFGFLLAAEFRIRSATEVVPRGCGRGYELRVTAGSRVSCRQ